MNDKAAEPLRSGWFARRSNGLWLCAIALAPLVSLFSVGSQYGLDWPCHNWLVAYFGEFFKTHLRFPDVINTGQLAGMHYPVFYGFLLYPVLGVVSAVTGPEIAIRVAVLAVLLLQARQVFHFTMLAGKDRALSLVTAAAVCWSTYALTNLYNRGALSEFFAVALLTCAVCTLGRMVLFESGWRQPESLLAGILFFVGAAGAHPITATFGAIGMIAVVAVLLPFSRDRLRLAGSLGVASLAIAVALSPWLYAVLKFSNALAVCDGQLITYYGDDIDSLATRLMPFPYDARMAGGPQVAELKVPYLDAQLSSALLVLALGLSVGAQRILRRADNAPGNARSLGLSWFLFVLLLAMSVLPALGHLLPAFTQNLQFAYRLVSYLNLSLLLVIVVARTVSQVSGPVQVNAWLLRGALALALIGLVIKLNHVEAVKTTNTPDRITWQDPHRMLELPDYFYGWRAYAITADTSLNFPRGDTVFMPLGKGREFSQAQPLKVQLAQAGNIHVRVQPFPWNHLVVDGHTITAAESRRQTGGITISLPPGEHEIAYVWRPDAAWVWLTNISRCVIALGLLLLLVNQVRARLSAFVTRPRSRPAPFELAKEPQVTR